VDSGGTGSWRTTFPTCGCQRPSPAVASAQNYIAEQGYLGLTRLLPKRARATVNYTATQGFLPDGNDISHTNLTWAEGIAQCSARSDCAGITFKSNSSKPVGTLPLYLKKCGGVERAAGWWSWSKPKSGPGAMPAPKMPAACALFCAVGESCDACHPDDDGSVLSVISVCPQCARTLCLVPVRLYDTLVVPSAAFDGLRTGTMCSLHRSSIGSSPTACKEPSTVGILWQVEAVRGGERRMRSAFERRLE
jgi:hypothetical protein